MSGILLDTNVISELIKPTPEPVVVEWIGNQARRHDSSILVA